jgi:Xaa-Pro aminopeptidase
MAGYYIRELADALAYHRSRPRGTWLFYYQIRNRWHFILKNYEWRTIVDRVLEVTKPGATGADLVRAAVEPDGWRPWLPYFYLAHGIGTDSAEMPLIGTDRGPEFDASIVLAPGMVLVFEPVVWQDGHCGHRSEEIVAVTEEGYLWLSSRAELDGVGI